MSLNIIFKYRQCTSGMSNSNYLAGRIINILLHRCNVLEIGLFYTTSVKEMSKMFKFLMKVSLYLGGTKQAKGSDKCECGQNTSFIYVVRTKGQNLVLDFDICDVLRTKKLIKGKFCW
jgi:hypothetical protein